MLLQFSTKYCSTEKIPIFGYIYAVPTTAIPSLSLSTSSIHPQSFFIQFQNKIGKESQLDFLFFLDFFHCTTIKKLTCLCLFLSRTRRKKPLAIHSIISLTYIFIYSTRVDEENTAARRMLKYITRKLPQKIHICIKTCNVTLDSSFHLHYQTKLLLLL